MLTTIATTSAGHRVPEPVTAASVTAVADVLLAADGFDGLSVRRIADRLGVSRQVVYTHFGGMSGLLDALHIDSSAQLSAAVAAVAARPGTVEHFLASTHVYIDMARQRPYHYQLLFERPLPDYVPSAAAQRAGRASFGHVVAAADAWLHHEPLTDPAREATWNRAATELARVLWTTGHGFVVLERAGYATPHETDTLSERSVTAILNGWEEAPLPTTPDVPQ